MTKSQLGQFFTTNSDYIFQGLEGFVKNKEITDPFAGFSLFGGQFKVFYAD